MARFGALLCVLAAITGGAAFFLQDRLFPDQPEEVAVAATESTPPAILDMSIRTERKESGPTIIRVNPDRRDTANGVLIIRDPSELSQSPLTAHMPDPDLLEESEFGTLPVRDSLTGRRPFDAYARPWSGARGARIAIIVGGLGISQTGTQRAIEKLPSEITLAFAPLGNSLGRWMQTARREGHEVMLQLPMEPFDYPNADPGGNVLLVEDDPARQLENLHRNLARITNYTGVINYMGARFSADRTAMDMLMAELASRGLGYLDDGSSARSLAQEVAGANGVPFAAADAMIDQVADRASVLGKLDELERIARAQGFAVGIGSALDVTVDTVAEWSREVRMRGVEIIPFSAAALDPKL